jgi:CDP-2,3-bis-(O-geranylgeranyl)-sn-glycerol synthase
MDCGLVWQGKRLLGDHKTWRGLVVGVTCGVITAVIQNNFWRLESYLKIDFFGGLADVILIGVLLSMGALVGDAMKSFIKRRLGVPSGKSLLIFDQIDYVVGAALITFPFVPLK